MTHKFISIILLAIALCACKDKSASNSPIKQYKLDGVIVSLNPQGHIANIDARKVEGWMDAMTMDYPVKDAAGFDTLHVGDHITATLYAQDLNYWLGEIHHVR
jgi:Cu/Ag efflux protein CusF